MYGMNMATWDRALRAAAGAVALATVLLGVAAGWVQIALAVFAVIMLGTSLLGYCPVYAVLGLSTRRPRHGSMPRP